VNADTRVSPGRRIGRMFAILLTFILVGPPIGAMMFMLVVALIGMGERADLAGLTWVALFSLIYAIPFGYLIGVGPAAAAGLLVGIRQAFFGRMRWYFAAATGILVGIGFQVGTGQRVLPSGDDVAAMRLQGPIMIATCLVATLFCWAIVRNWYHAPNSGTAA
jgi:hypothetical protein